MTRAKKAQITIFFTIGLVLLILITILVYTVQESANYEQTQAAITPEARQYLAQCIDNAAYDVFDSLKEPTIAITPPSIESSSDAGDEGLEDSLQELLGPVEDSYERVYTSTLFGTDTLRGSCDPEGPNARLQTTNPRCGAYAYGVPSTQEHLTNNATRALEECAQRGVDLDVEAPISEYPSPEVETIYGRETMTIRATYPQGVIERAYDVRLATLASWTHERIAFSTRDPRIIIENEAHASLSGHYREGFGIEREGEELRFYDASSRYRGETLEIRVIVEARQDFYDEYEDETYTPGG